jgi:transposase
MSATATLYGPLYARPKISDGVVPVGKRDRATFMGRPQRVRKVELDEDELRELYEQGLSREQIATRLGVSKNVVHCRLAEAFERGTIDQKRPQRGPKPKLKKPPRVRPMAKFAGERFKDMPPATPIELPEPATLAIHELCARVRLSRAAATEYFAPARLERGVYDTAGVRRLLSTWAGQTFHRLPKLYTAFEAEDRLAFARRTLATARCGGWGPRWFTIGNVRKGRVLYTQQALDHYARTRPKRGTNEQQAA